MTGGLIQLVAYGVQDLFLTRDPQITLFKIVFRRHTNFQIEQVPQYFIEEPDFGKRVSCLLSRQGDLVKGITLVINLPRIKSIVGNFGGTLQNVKFAWVRKIGYAIIKYVEIEIGGQTIDKHYSEWLNLWDELFGNKNTDDGLNKMIGNVPELYNFTDNKEAYTLYLPLRFWFCNNPGLALPIVALQYADVKINVEFNDLDKCFITSPTNYMEIYAADDPDFLPNDFLTQTVNKQTATGLFSFFDLSKRTMYFKKISRNDFKTIDRNGNISIRDSIASIFSSNANRAYLIYGSRNNYFVIGKFGTSSKSSTSQNIDNISIGKCFLLVDYVYLDDEERKRIINTKHDYLIEQVSYVSEKVIQSSNIIFKLDLTQPSKLLVWVVQYDYFFDNYNSDYFNYTNSPIYNGIKPSGKSLIISETIILNGKERINKRSYQYFNYLQIYQNLEHSVNEGINFYSFSLFPNKYQPSGSCNMSQIDNIQIDLTVSNDINTSNPAKFRCYSLNHNVLKIVNGLAGLVFI